MQEMEHRKKEKIADQHHHQNHLTQTPTTGTVAATAQSGSSSSQIFSGTQILPEGIIFEILKRLPVKSLIKFKTICNKWNSLITSQHFIKAHLYNSTINPDFTHHRLLISALEPYPYFNLRQASFPTLLHQPTTVATAVSYPMTHAPRTVWLVGSCDGLICISVDERGLYVWNPSTRKSRKLPNLGTSSKYGFFAMYGFGYDEIGDDYKVVAIFSVFQPASVKETEVRVFSLKSGSWKRIEGFNRGVPLFASGKFVNGKLHWVMNCDNDSPSGLDWHIAFIDLGSEVSGEVEQPEDITDAGNSVLAVSGGHLCLLCDYPRIRFDVWLMKDYGVKESWSRVVSIPYVEKIEKNYMYSTPLRTLRDGRIFMGFGSSFAIYDPVDASLTYREIDIDIFLEAEIYVESLVSPDADDGQVQQ